MNLYDFLSFHISTLDNIPQCLSLAQCIARRSQELTTMQTALLLQALSLKEDDVALMDQFVEILDIKNNIAYF